MTALTGSRVSADVTARLEARVPGRMAPGLEHITMLAELLGRPDQAYPSVQVTGTNGKGSIAAMVASLLGALGLTSGTYSSPHLQDVTERIRVAGQPVPPDVFADRLDELEPYIAEVDARSPTAVSYFEVLTAMAFAHFADAPVDVGVFEVGMGGTWDATNIVRGEAAAIGPIGLDHPELGSTPEAVAAEKAGIIKPDAVVVTSRQEPGVDRVLAERARRVGAQLLRLGTDVDVEQRTPAVGGQLLTIRGVTDTFADVHLPLLGAHQAAHAAVALGVVEGFLGFAGGLDPDVIRAGFAAVRMPGRLEVVRREGHAPVLLDGAHNPLGAASLAEALPLEVAARHRVGVLAMLGDKNVEGIIEVLAPLLDHVVVTAVDSPRAADPERLSAVARRHGLPVETAADVASAIEKASGVATREDLVVVAGSLYAVGAARDALGLPVT